MKNKIGAFGAGQFSLGTLVGPTRHHYRSKPGGGGGGSHTRTRPGHPPSALGSVPSVEVHIPNSLWHTEAWQSKPQLETPHQSMVAHIPNSRGQTKTWESISPTLRATPEGGSPDPQQKGPHQTAAHHCAAWGSISPNRGATLKRGSPYPQLNGPHSSMGVQVLNSRGHSQARESISTKRGATPKGGIKSISPT